MEKGAACNCMGNSHHIQLSQQFDSASSVSSGSLTYPQNIKDCTSGGTNQRFIGCPQALHEAQQWRLNGLKRSFKKLVS